MIWENIPQELKDEALFCAWKLTSKGKEPFNVLTNRHAKSNDKSTFAPFAIVLQHLSRYYKFDGEGKNLGGLGLGIFNGFSAIDIDHCVNNGEVNEMARDIIDYCQSYTEYSPSGNGIRIIFKTKTELDKSKYYINNHKSGLEIYISENTNKYVTLTGNVLNPLNINVIDIQYILDKYMLKGNKIAKNEFNINNYKKDIKFQDLWNNLAPGSGSNESELDLALCNKLAYYLKGDVFAINNAFIKSPYYKSKDAKHIKKWDRQDYREATISQAINSINSQVQVNEFSLTDTGNAHFFVEKFLDFIRYNVDNKKWMMYNDQYWQMDIHNNIKNYAELVIEEMKYKAKATTSEELRKAALKNVRRVLQSSGKIAMIKESEHIEGIPVTNSDFDKNKFLFNTKSGIIDLKRKKKMKHDANQMLSKISPYEPSYDEPKLWLKFLNEIFENDKSVIDYIQRVMGYAMTSDTTERCMFCLIGDGMNGKSVLLDVLRQILGSYATTSNINILLDKKMQNNANMGDVARLNGMRCVITNEAELTDKLKESAIKTITSGNDNITARFLYGEEFEFTPECKIFMASNYKPRIIGTDLGIWSRIKMIMFNVTFDEYHQDKNLKDKLLEEGSQILGWAIKGYAMWEKIGLAEPKKFKSAKKEYRSEMDVVQQWVEKNCVNDPNHREKSMDLFDNFSVYVSKAKEYQLTLTMFGRNLSKKFIKKKYLGVMWYMGIRIKKHYDDILTKAEKDEV